MEFILQLYRQHSVTVTSDFLPLELRAKGAMSLSSVFSREEDGELLGANVFGVEHGVQQ